MTGTAMPHDDESEPSPQPQGDVITDLDILSAVQAVLGTTAPPAE